MYNTVNASLGPDQPCSDQGTSPAVPDQLCTPYFNPGIYDQREINLNVDLSYSVNDMVNVAGGLERRNERFEIVEGGRPLLGRRSAGRPGIHTCLQRFQRFRAAHGRNMEP